ncbi:thioredoxin reductase GliT [Akanthomyces lecanii RCEF 1005]|uniref:Thioredoxin reductase GliT n=1 Tax=Akanthomyces lecanii RCEF 1005 TaxID=1081108 RepID=A0A168F226_CORDF|nr:thioredoxin reductase GliT [Akanthomyces lecanii RCEF 1005]
MAQVYDVLILGGGPAGLAMATTLARQACSALVIDGGTYRNERAARMHNVPGFDHVPPADFRSKLRQDLEARYPSISFQDATTIVEVRQRVDSSSGGGYETMDAAAAAAAAATTHRIVQNVTAAEEKKKLADARFEARDEQGNVYHGRKLGIATGVRDKVEEQVDGYADCWGRGIFHCLFCDGFEERGASSVGVLGVGLLSAAPALSHVGLLAKRLASRITIYTNGDAALAAALPAPSSASATTVETRRITKLAMKDYPASSIVIVTLEDGTTREEGFLASHPWVEQGAPSLAAQLGLEMKDEAGGPLVVLKSPMGETSVPGCFAAGDAAVAMKSVVQAVAGGQMAGAGMVFELLRELHAKDEL